MLSPSITDVGVSVPLKDELRIAHQATVDPVHAAIVNRKVLKQLLIHHQSDKVAAARDGLPTQSAVRVRHRCPDHRA
jgi:hypothetical protein